MSPKDLVGDYSLESTLSSDFTTMAEAYPHDPDAELNPVHERCSLYPKDSTLEERIAMRIARVTSRKPYAPHNV